MDKMKELSGFFRKNGWLLIFLLTGLLLMCVPGRSEKKDASGGATDNELRLAGALSRMEGVGEVYVLLAERSGREAGYSGAVVVCAGGSDPGVRLKVTEAVRAFTSLGSDRIIVQKLIS